MDKRITMEEAVKQVQPGSMLGLGGMTLYRRPVAFVVALIRHCVEEKQAGRSGISGLTLMAFTGSYESDLLVGAGIVSKVRSCYFGMEIFGFAPMFSDFTSHGRLEVIEETEASLALGLRAQSARIGFLPGRAWIGTDLPRLRPDLQTVTDPYTGEKLMAFPAISPDVAVIHALRADIEGNAQIGENLAVDPELALASKTVIVTAEEIVPELKKAELVAPVVQAVVHAPKGASPSSCHPLYPMDGEAILEYTEQVSNEASFWDYMGKKWGIR